MSQPKSVYFFDNGNTAVEDERGKQMPELQKSWCVLFLEFLESKGIDPTGFTLHFTCGDAKAFKSKCGWNWSFGRTDSDFG